MSTLFVQKYFVWDETINALVRLAWENKCRERYRSMLSQWRTKGKPQFISDEIWESWLPHWNTEKFKAKSAQCSKNRLSETGGPGAGPSRHTGGSLAHRDHAKKLVSISHLSHWALVDIRSSDVQLNLMG